MSTVKNTGRIKAILLALCLVTIAGVFAWIQYPSKERVVNELRHSAIQASRSPDAETVAKAWDWEKFSEQEVLGAAKEARARSKADNDDEEREEIPFDVVTIYHALGNVELDQLGDVVVDANALQSLEAAFRRLHVSLDEDGLAELQELIRIGLPGKAGEQTAEIVGDYYRYQLEEAVFRESNPPSDYPASALNEFEQLVALRHAHLGYEVAEQLYGQEQARTRYTLEQVKIHSDPTLSEEEKRAQQEALGEQYPQELFDGGGEQGLVDTSTDEWRDRFEAFDRERSYLVDAGLAEEALQAETDQLLAKYFDEQEIAVARHYDPAGVEADEEREASSLDEQDEASADEEGVQQEDSAGED